MRDKIFPPTGPARGKAFYASPVLANATPAPDGRQIFFRSNRNLYCIAPPFGQRAAR